MSLFAFGKKHYPVSALLKILVLASLLPGVIGLTIFALFSYQQERKRLIQDNTRRAMAVEERIEDEILRTQALVRSFAGADEILQADLRAFSRRAARAIKASGLGSHVLVYRLKDGQVVRYSGTENRFVAADTDTSAARTVLERGVEVVSDVVIEHGSNRSYVQAHVPVIIGAETVYSIAIAISTKQLSNVLIAERLPAGWLASFIDRKGVIAGRNRQSEKFVGQPASSQLREAFSKSATGTLETITRDGIPNLTAFSRSPRIGYTTVIGVPQAEVVGVLTNQLVYLVGPFVLLLGAGLLLARHMSQRISRSVQALIAPAISLGKGTPLAVDRVHLSEANEVADALSRAAELLKRRDAALLAQQEELQQFYFFNENANEILLLLDESGRIRYANRSAAARLGYSNAELLGMTILEIDPETTPARLSEAFAQSRSTQIAPFEREYRCKDGSGVPVEINITVLEHKGEWLMLVAPRDISERLQAERALRWAASHDGLTRLPNRVAARNFLGQTLAGSHAGEQGMVLFIDLDRFKPVNDLYGHEVGDRVLVEVSQRLNALIPQDAMLARIGGDEFIVVLPDSDEDVGRDEQFAMELIHAVSLPINLGGIEVKLSASVGISRYPEHGRGTDVLLHAADLAMLQAKHHGRNRFSFYSPDMDERAQFVTTVERRLQQTLDNGRLALHFQPIVNLRSGAVDAVEALVRLADDIQPPLGPATFIPIAEKCGLVVPIGEWVWFETCRQLVRWREAGIALQASVNVSALQFQRTDFLSRIGRLIAVSGVDPRWLVIELTETAVMENLDEAVQILGELKNMGIRIALDDFGTGYSSLSILSTLPIDKIKIDQSFVRRLETDHASCAVTDAIIAMANSLNLEIVAEGIETEATLRYLNERGCQQGQGYYFSRPLTAAALVDWHGAWKQRLAAQFA